VGFNRGHFFSALLGALVAVVVMAALPAVAGNGDNLVLGEKNTAKTVTRLNTRGGLRIDNFKAGNPALILNVADVNTPPMLVNSTERVLNLNADLLDGWDHTDFVPTDQACTEEGSSVVGIDASGLLQCLVGGATTTTTTTLGVCSIDDDCAVCRVCVGGDCEDAATLTDPKDECGPYYCSGFGTCASSCVVDADCKGPNVCSPQNTCVAP